MRTPCLYTLIALLVAGCADQSAGPPSPSQSTVDARTVDSRTVDSQKAGSPAVNSPNVERDYFAVAIEFLKQRDEHNVDRSAGQATYYLNRWIRDQAADPRWTLDPLVNTLPEATRRAPATKEMVSERSLAGFEFVMGDVLFLEENRWLHAVAQWATQKSPTGPVAQWIQESSGLSPKSMRSLANCTVLFDWAVRNIQLDELLAYPKETAAGPQSGGAADAAMADWTPPMRALPGPGYDKMPWHVLMYGHGDSFQRARIFLLLARQLRVDVVMLAIDQKTGRAREWLPAVLLDKQLYLFDPELGLPLPGPGGVGIATLGQVIADPQLLESLDLGEKYRYRVHGADLSHVVALIDASPAFLAQRMKLVEQALDAADQMVLSYSPAAVRQQLKECEGIQDTRLWAVPFEAAAYQQARAALLATNQELQWQEFIEHGVFQGLSAVVRARRQHLLGNFEKHGDDPGATSLYLAARMSNAQIEEIQKNREIQRALGLEKTIDMTDREWEQRIAQIQRLQTESKQHASYWLGLSHMEQRDYQVAANWLKTRTLDANPEGPWKNGARYNLARCYEALGRVDEARQLYLIDDSPQRHGCLLRARQLETLTSTQKPAE